MKVLTRNGRSANCPIALNLNILSLIIVFKVCFLSNKQFKPRLFQNRYQKVASDLYESTEAAKYFKSTDDEDDLPTGFQDRLIAI